MLFDNRGGEHMVGTKTGLTIIYSRNLLILFLIAASLLPGCNRDRGSIIVPEPAAAEAPPSVRLLNNTGAESTVFSSYETPRFMVEGLIPYKVYKIEVIEIDPIGTDTIIGRYAFTSNRDGTIPPTQVAYDPEPGFYRLFIPGIPLEALFHVSSSDVPCFYVCNEAGEHRHSFSTGESVYVTGTGLRPGPAGAFIVDDHKNWYAGEYMHDYSGAAETVVIGPDGYLPPSLVWSEASEKERFDFDLVLDLNLNGRYDETDCVDAQAGSGFVIQDPPGQGNVGASHITEPLVIDAHWIDKEYFSKDEDIYLRLNPRIRIPNLPLDLCVDWVIVPHALEWVDQAPLQTVCPQVTDTLHGNSTGAGRRPAWPAPLMEGNYTAVLDIDRDGVYDQGLDVIHGEHGSGIPSRFQVVAPAETRDWTVLIFADGDGTDNPLHESRFAYLDEISLALHSPSRLHVAMFFDGAEGYTPSTAGYYTIRAGEWACVKDLGEVCCGEPDVLHAFLMWGITHFPAQHYLITISDHGGAWFEAGHPVPVEPEPATRAIAYDEGDALNMYELERVYRNLTTVLGRKADIIWYQACLMGCIETASASDEYFDFMAAHETVRLSSENAGKWDSLIRFMEGGSPDARAIAEEITYAMPCARTSCAVSYDLGALPLLESKIRDLCEAADILEELNHTSIITTVQKTRDLNLSEYPPLKPPLDHQRDLFDFFFHISRSLDPPYPLEFRDRAEAVLACAPQVVLACQSDNTDFRGMSIWLPETLIQIEKYCHEFARMGFGKNTGWEAFLRSFHEGPP